MNGLMKQAIQKSLNWAVILSETSHVFCCVFPTIFSLIGILAGVGMFTVMPASLISAHNFIHELEVPMIISSGVILALGWAVTWYSGRIDCHSTGCAHGTCAPRKSRAHLVLKIATVLFVVNVVVYATIHRSTWFADKSSLMTQESPINIKNQ